MQFILTQQEYDALLREKRLRSDGEKAKLQALCTLAANHIPVLREWSPDVAPAPWGCILGPLSPRPEYCDECPAKDVCPHDGKEWSK